MSPDHSHALLGTDCIMLILFMSVEFVFKVLYLLVLIGLNQWLCLDHLFLILHEAHFLQFWEGFCGVENWGIMPLSHVVVTCLL